MDINDQIIELRAELKACVFTQSERAAAQAQLAALIARRDAEARLAQEAIRETTDQASAKA